MQSILSALTTPKSKSEFMECYKANKVFVVHDLKNSIQQILDLPFLQSLDGLLNCWPHKVEAHLPNITDEANAVEISTADAKTMFENGMGLLFNDANTISPVLTDLLNNLRREMGFSALTYGRNLIYATKANKGTAPHFDQNINFVIQIHGTKKWWLAPNTNVDAPLTRYTMGLSMDAELAGYATGTMPTEMPSDATEYILKPGSMLFVPRGYWHSTEAVTDAMSLNFTFSAPTWIDLFSAALRSRLSQIPQWRATADFVSNPEHHDSVAAEFNTLLDNLSKESSHWRAERFLSATEAADDTW
jgi:50S ribosomal protein L16 3-hydroxylase